MLLATDTFFQASCHLDLNNYTEKNSNNTNKRMIFIKKYVGVSPWVKILAENAWPPKLEPQNPHKCEKGEQTPQKLTSDLHTCIPQ